MHLVWCYSLQARLPSTFLITSLFSFYESSCEYLFRAKCQKFRVLYSLHTLGTDQILTFGHSNNGLYNPSVTAGNLAQSWTTYTSLSVIGTVTVTITTVAPCPQPGVITTTTQIITTTSCPSCQITTGYVPCLTTVYGQCPCTTNIGCLTTGPGQCTTTVCAPCGYTTGPGDCACGCNGATTATPFCTSESTFQCVTTGPGTCPTTCYSQCLTTSTTQCLTTGCIPCGGGQWGVTTAVNPLPTTSYYYGYSTQPQQQGQPYTTITSGTYVYVVYPSAAAGQAQVESAAERRVGGRRLGSVLMNGFAFVTMLLVPLMLVPMMLL